MKSDMYSKYAKEYDLAARDNIYNALFERPSLQALLGDVNGLDVIDLGCGSGIYAEYFISQGAKSVTCLDISKEMIQIVKSKLGNQVKPYAQDLSLGLPKESSNSADIIVCPLVLHYIENLSVIFRETYRVLKPGGHMVFSTHHPFADFEYSESRNYFKRELLNQEWDTIGEPVTVTFFRRSLSEICEAITSSGLGIVTLSEGKVSEDIKTASAATYDQLSTKPSFLFVKCIK
ncbi:MAG: class I SAM-dependent methyltransferase [Desulfotalea sp.]